jgi:hypothetical protein
MSFDSLGLLCSCALLVLLRVMHAQALMAASNASNEQRLALREDLKRQLADMRAMQEAAERTKAEQQELLARIAAMESKVGHLQRSDTRSVICILVCACVPPCTLCIAPSRLVMAAVDEQVRAVTV